MSRIFNLILLAAMIIGAAVTYDMKHKAELAADNVAALQAEIARAKQDVSLLKAEWSMLTQPGRLQSVVAKYADHFQLQPFTPSQIATIDEIPLKPTGVSQEDSAALARIAAGDAGPLR